MRKSVIENILYTDMSKHFPFMAELKACVLKEDFDPVEKHKGDMLKALVHGADVGNPTRPMEISRMWSLKILREFFSQGDKEKSLGLEVSNLCDRKTTNVAGSQVGFIGFVVYPYFESLCKIFPKMSYTLEQMDSNRDAWKGEMEKWTKTLEANGNSDI